MAVISGRKLAINNSEGSLIDWMVEHTLEPIPIVLSNTNSGVLQACGLKDWAGEYNMVAVEPNVLPGLTYTFTGSAEGANGVTGPIIGKRLTISAQPMSNAPFMTKVEFEGNGAPTFGAQVLSDATSPVPVCSVYGTVSSLSGLDVAAWQLVLEAENIPYASTETSGYYKRLTGNFTGLAQVRVFTDDGSALPQVGDILSAVEFKVGANAGDKWVLSYMKVVSLKPAVKANPNPRLPVPWDMVWAFTSQNAAGTDGSVVSPGSVTVWPYPAGY